ncbi:MAG: hypothetical protein IKG66_07970, partial [Lachnospiraceae bacterium]|nr:hypothetical protein [Lachnospiraceae bacterium]
NLFFPVEIIDDVETTPTFVYDGYARSPEWIEAFYEGMEEGLDPDASDLDPEGEYYSFIFSLPGGAQVRLTGSGYSDAGTHVFEPAGTFLEGSGNNYEFAFTDNTIVIEPVEIVLISKDTFAVTSDVYISEYGLEVQANNIWAEAYEVVSTGENEWRINFDWGDKIDVGKLLTKDGNTFTITPMHQFVSGDPGNYSIETQDQEGTMIDPAYAEPDGLFGSMLMKKASALIAANPADETGTSDADSGEDPEEEEEAGEEDPDEENGGDAGAESGQDAAGRTGADATEDAAGRTGADASEDAAPADPAASEPAQEEEALTEEEAQTEEPQEEPRKEEPEAEVPQKEEPRAEEPEKEEPQAEEPEEEEPQAEEPEKSGPQE